MDDSEIKKLFKSSGEISLEKRKKFLQQEADNQRIIERAGNIKNIRKENCFELLEKQKILAKKFDMSITEVIARKWTTEYIELRDESYWSMSEEDQKEVDLLLRTKYWDKVTSNIIEKIDEKKNNSKNLSDVGFNSMSNVIPKYLQVNELTPFLLFLKKDGLKKECNIVFELLFNPFAENKYIPVNVEWAVSNFKDFKVIIEDLKRRNYVIEKTDSYDFMIMSGKLRHFKLNPVLERRFINIYINEHLLFSGGKYDGVINDSIGIKIKNNMSEEEIRETSLLDLYETKNALFGR